MNGEPAKVGLVGTGLVGSSFAYALMQRGIASELVMIDRDSERAVGEAMDLNHGLPFVRPMRIAAGEYSDLAGARVVVIAAGANQRPGQSRLDLFRENAEVFHDVVPKVIAANPNGLILVATNPVDLLTELTDRISGLPPGRVLGSGTTLDTARFRTLLGAHYDVDPRNMHAYIIGEHGDSQLPVWSLAQIAGVPLREFVGPNGQRYDREALEQIAERTRTAAAEIIRRKKATHYAIGLALVTIVTAILRNERTILTVCRPVRGAYGLEGISLGLPNIVGSAGALEILTLPLDRNELAALNGSAELLKTQLAQLG